MLDEVERYTNNRKTDLQDKHDLYSFPDPVVNSSHSCVDTISDDLLSYIPIYFTDFPSFISSSSQYTSGHCYSEPITRRVEAEILLNNLGTSGLNRSSVAWARKKTALLM